MLNKPVSIAGGLPQVFGWNHCSGSEEHKVTLDYGKKPAAPRHSTLVIFCCASGGCMGVAIAAEQVCVARQAGFGANQLPAFLVWLVPLSLAVGASAVALGATRCPPWLRHVVSLCAGVATGDLWTRFVQRALGLWFGAFVIPVYHLWILGAVVGLLCGSIYVHMRGTWNRNGS